MGQKRAENVEKLVVGALLRAWACGLRVRIMFQAFWGSWVDVPQTAFSLHPLLSQKWVGAPTFVHCPLTMQCRLCAQGKYCNAGRLCCFLLDRSTSGGGCKAAGGLMMGTGVVKDKQSNGASYRNAVPRYNSAIICCSKTGRRVLRSCTCLPLGCKLILRICCSSAIELGITSRAVESPAGRGDILQGIAKSA